jgi:hypothetical protein
MKLIMTLDAEDTQTEEPIDPQIMAYHIRRYLLPEGAEVVTHTIVNPNDDQVAFAAISNITVEVAQ